MENTTASTNQNSIPLMQQTLPNATTVLVLGILSIVTCWCVGIPGVTMGIIALVLSGRSKKLYLENQQNYTEASFKNLNAGRICAIIGTILSGIYLLWAMVYWLFLGAAMSTMFTEFPWDSF